MKNDKTKANKAYAVTVTCVKVTSFVGHLQISVYVGLLFIYTAWNKQYQEVYYLRLWFLSVFIECMNNMLNTV